MRSVKCIPRKDAPEPTNSTTVPVAYVKSSSSSSVTTHLNHHSDPMESDLVIEIREELKQIKNDVRHLKDKAKDMQGDKFFESFQVSRLAKMKTSKTFIPETSSSTEITFPPCASPMEKQSSPVFLSDCCIEWLLEKT